MDEKNDQATRQQIMQFMTTEHFTLQTARAGTVAEANGRASQSKGTNRAVARRNRDRPRRSSAAGEQVLQPASRRV